MEVNVLDSLAGIFTAVIDRSVSLTYAADLSNLCDCLGDLRRIESTLRICCKSVHVIEMLFRNNKNVYGRNGIDVLKAKDIIVLIYFC